MTQSADTVLKGGRIWCGKQEGFVEAIAIKDGKVLAAGSEAEIMALSGSTTQVIELAGKLAIPGLNDAHTHLAQIGLHLRDIDARPSEVDSIAEICARIGERAAKSAPGTWIAARGYDETKTPEKRHPTREELDRVAPDNPVFVARTCGHVGVANSAALALANISESSPEPSDGVIGRDDGKLNGFLAENARFPLFEIMPKPDLDDYVKAIEAAGHILLSYGITSTMDAAVGMNDGWLELQGFRAASEVGRLPVRLTACLIADKEKSILDQAIAEGLKTGEGDDMLRIGPAKFFTDGSASSGTAAMTEPYLHVGGHGVMCITEEECLDLARKAHSNGFQMAIHAIGDVAIDMILDAFETVQAEMPVADIRHRVEHCGWVRPEQIERLVALNVIPSPQLNFIYFHGENYLRAMGLERTGKSHPMRRFIDAGLHVPASTDCPSAPLSPFEVIYGMVARKSWKGTLLGADEATSMAEALHAYTYESAYAAHDEERKGRLVPGQYADIAVMSCDLFTIDHEDILKTECVMTLRGGKVVFERETTEA